MKISGTAITSDFLSERKIQLCIII